MAINAFIGKLRARLHNFRAGRGGNVLITFALATVPLVGLVGSAVDYSRGNSLKVAIQAAVDATALALSKDANSISDSDLQPKADAHFRALFTRPEAKNIQVTAVKTTVGESSITVGATATIDTSFMGVFGINQMNVGSSGTVVWGDTKVRVGLVLDLSGSMNSSGKIGALKTATTNLLTQLQNSAPTNGDVYVSIVPFDKDVNVDPANRTANWVRWDDGTDLSWDGANGTCSKSGGYSPRSVCVAESKCSNTTYTTQSTCVAHGTCSKSGYTTQSTCVAQGTCSQSGYTTQSTCVAQGTCSKAGYTTQSTCVAQGTCSKSTRTTQSTCVAAGGTWTPATWTPATWTWATWTPYTWTAVTWTPESHNNWTGCVTDRDQNYDTTNAAVDSTIPATMAPAEKSKDVLGTTACTVSMMGLSYNWTALQSKVAAMAPATSFSATNQAIGLQWGFQSLTSAPFTIPALDPNFTTRQVIILLTDGLNTVDRWYPYGVSSSEANINARQAITCANVKAAGITLFTIQVNTTGDPTSTVLQNCASPDSAWPAGPKFFVLTSGTAIGTTFDKIAAQLATRRVAR